jgi:GNAT superfamily N-acetyltransferase
VSADPVAPVEAQLRAYNDRDIEAFLAPYAADVEIRDFSGEVLMRGHDEMRARYLQVFADERLHAVITARMVMGPVVIDQERVSRTVDGRPGMVEAIAIYEVRDGLIARVTFIRGARRVLEEPATPGAGALGIRRIERAGDEALLEGLMELLADCVHAGASIGFLAPLAPEAARAYWKEILDSLSPNLAVWVAERSGRVVGTVQLALATKENGRHRAEVQKLMVMRSARGEGVASRLMAAAEAHARAERRTLLVLDTLEGSEAEPVYRHLGWQRVGEMPGYAARPDGALHATVYYYKRLG